MLRADPHLASLPPGPVLVLGVDLGESAELAALRAARPDARVVTFSRDDAPTAVERMPKHPLSAYPRLARRRWAAVIALQDYRNLCAFALALPARRHLVVADGALRPLRVGEVLSAELDRRTRRVKELWGSLRMPLPAGAGNDWGFLEERLAGLAPGWPAVRASVIVPVFDRREVLRKTLTGLALQDYPRSLFEVIVADDGSTDHPEALVDELASRLDVRIVRQEHDGYRLAAVRNLALAAARGDVVVSLDCDMLPPPGYLSAMLRWFHVHDGPLVVIGGRHYVNTDGLTADEIADDFGRVERLPRVAANTTGRLLLRPTVDWREPEIARTRRMKTHAVPYALASGGNVAFRRSDALAAGGYCEAFRQWGCEDEDFAYRLYRRGAYFIPEPGAAAYHQEHPVSPAREEERLVSRDILASRVPYYRGYLRQRAIETPKVSVFVPAFNAAPWLGEAIESALAQTVTDLEVCVCDDGSTDGTAALLAERYGRHPRVRFVSQPNGGSPRASRTAVELCRGEFVLQLDADDRLLPTAAEKLLALMEPDPRVSLAYGGYRRVDAEGRLLNVVPAHPYDRARHLVANIVSHPRMFRIRDYHRTSGFDPTLPVAEDFDFYLKLAEQGLVRYTPEILYVYRWHAGNQTQTRWQQMVRCHELVIERALARRGLRGNVRCVDRGGRVEASVELEASSAGSVIAGLRQRVRLWALPRPREQLRRAARKAWARLTGR